MEQKQPLLKRRGYTNDPLEGEADFPIRKQQKLQFASEGKQIPMQLPQNVQIEEEEEKQQKKGGKKKRKPVGVFIPPGAKPLNQTVDEYFSGLQNFVKKVNADIPVLDPKQTGAYFIDNLNERVALSTAINVRQVDKGWETLTMTVNQFKIFLSKIKYNELLGNLPIAFDATSAYEHFFGKGNFDVPDFIDIIYGRKNFGQHTEKVLIAMLAAIIGGNDTYWTTFGEKNEETTPELFRFFSQSDSLKRIINFEAPNLDPPVVQLTYNNEPLIPGYSQFIKFVTNILQIDVDRAYFEYMTMFQPDTEPPRLGNDDKNVIQKGGFLGLKDKYLYYSIQKVSMERFAGALSVSKKHCIYVLWFIFKFIQWSRDQPWYNNTTQHVYERIFIPQALDNVSIYPPSTKAPTPFYGLASYFLVETVHYLNIMRQNISREYLFSLQTNLVNVEPLPGMYSFPVDRFIIKEGYAGKLKDYTLRIRGSQALDISNFMRYKYLEAGELLDYDVDNVNLESMKGLIKALESNYAQLELQLDRDYTHYVTFIMRMPITQINVPPDVPEQDEEEFIQHRFKQLAAGDLETGQEQFVRGVFYTYKTGNLILSQTQVGRLLDKDNQEIVTLYKYVAEVIKDQFDQMLENYGWEDGEECDYTRMQILQYNVFSVPNRAFRLDVPPGNQLFTSQNNIQFFGKAQALTPQLKQKKYYTPCDDFPDFELLNCVFQTFGYIWLKMNGGDTLSISEYNDRYINSEFYKKNKATLEINNVFLNLELFRKHWSDKIQLVLPESQVIYYEEIEEPSFIIKFASEHCWIDRQSLPRSANKNSYERGVFKLCLPSEPQKDKKKKKERQSKKESQKKITQVKIFYDIETLSLQGHVDRSYGTMESFTQVPCLLCAEVQKGDLVEKFNFFHELCTLGFVEFLRELSKKDAEQAEPGEEFQYLIFAHNGNCFDHLFLFPILIKFFGSDVQFAGTSSHLKFLKVGKRFTFIDTRDLMPGGLADLAEQFGTEHKKLKFDVTRITEEQLQDEQFRKDLLKYCELDVTVLREVYSSFVQTLKHIVPIKDEDVKSTIASTAMNVFRKFFIPKEIKQIYGNKPEMMGYKVQQFERHSYYGGVCQVWDYNKVKQGSLYYDFVSMYPTILANDAYPVSQGYFQGQRETINDKNRIRQQNLYILTQFLFDDEALTPNLPVRNPKTKTSIYCLRWKADQQIPFLIYWGTELFLAFDQLGLKSIDVSGMVVYSEHAKLFEKYVSTFFKVKKNSPEGPLRSIAKIFLNSLYGKFGQLPTGQKKIINRREVMVAGVEGLSQESVRNASMKQLIQLNENENVKFIKKLDEDFVEVEFSPNQLQTNYCGSLIRLASYTTMKGRCRLFSVISALMKKNVKVYYCDTDSVCCDPCDIKTILSELGIKIGKELGNIAPQFEEGVDILEGEFIAPKCYYLELSKEYKPGKKQYIRCKGIINPTVEKLKQLSAEGQHPVTQNRWERKFGMVRIVEQIKKLLIKPKRIKNLINLTTKPFLNYFDFV